MKQIFCVTAMLALAALSVGCEDKNVELTIINRMSNVQLEQVQWTNHFVSYNLLPGQRDSIKVSCYNSEKEWPKKGPIQFTMTLNGKVIYLKTSEIIRLDCDEIRLFEINDSTEVEIF